MWHYKKGNRPPKRFGGFSYYLVTKGLLEVGKVGFEGDHLAR